MEVKNPENLNLYGTAATSSTSSTTSLRDNQGKAIGEIQVVFESKLDACKTSEQRRQVINALKLAIKVVQEDVNNGGRVGSESVYLHFNANHYGSINQEFFSQLMSRNENELGLRQHVETICTHQKAISGFRFNSIWGGTNYSSYAKRVKKWLSGVERKNINTEVQGKNSEVQRKGSDVATQRPELQKAIDHVQEIVTTKMKEITSLGTLDQIQSQHNKIKNTVKLALQIVQTGINNGVALHVVRDKSAIDSTLLNTLLDKSNRTSLETICKHSNTTSGGKKFGIFGIYTPEAKGIINWLNQSLKDNMRGIENRLQVQHARASESSIREQPIKPIKAEKPTPLITKAKLKKYSIKPIDSGSKSASTTKPVQITAKQLGLAKDTNLELDTMAEEEREFAQQIMQAYTNNPINSGEKVDDYKERVLQETGLLNGMRDYYRHGEKPNAKEASTLDESQLALTDEEKQLLVQLTGDGDKPFNSGTLNSVFSGFGHFQFGDGELGIIMVHPVLTYLLTNQQGRDMTYNNSIFKTMQERYSIYKENKGLADKIFKRAFGLVNTFNLKPTGEESLHEIHLGYFR